MTDLSPTTLPKSAPEAIRATIREHASSGIKGVELACEVVSRHPDAADAIAGILATMVAAGELVEIEYVTPENESDGVARLKSFYLPAGTRVSVVPNPGR